MATDAGSRNAKGEWRPNYPVRYAPIFVWPPRGKELLKWLLSYPGFLWPWNSVYLLITVVCWFYFQPSLERCATWQWDWIAQMALRNLALIWLVAGGWHLLLYTFRAQGTERKYDARWLRTGDRNFTFKNQLWDNIFWSCVSGVPIWTAYEVGYMWAAANGHVPYVSWREQPVYCALWRTAPCELPKIEVSDVLNGDPRRPPTIVEPDTILTGQKDRIGWYHRNIKSVGPKEHAEVQGMTGYQRDDPLLHRTFGALITAATAQRLDDTHLRSATGHFDIYVLTQHPATPAQWLAAIEALVGPADFDAHKKWWADFWNRSWIRVTGNEDAAYVSQMYALQRFITACAGRGRYPIKFNGSLFTVPAAGAPGDADYRRWGPGYWWQNTRLPYYYMPAAGDCDLLEPLWRLYVDDYLPLNKYRTKQYFGYDDAAYYIECVQFWGDVFNDTYGWQPRTERADPLQASPWHKWEWVAGPELVWMMLDHYEHTLEAALLRQRIIPTATAVMRFFDLYYQTDAAGQLVMHPAQALETWWNCTNPMPELAGLRAMTARLLALPESATPPESRADWTTFLAKLPPLPTRDTPAGKALAPAETFADKRNCENAELYAVFPFRLCAFEKDNRDLGVQAFHQREDRGHAGWRQDDVFSAYLGLADETRQAVVARARNHDQGERFPAFWGPNYDWTPDQCHGGVLMKTLQAMLLQTDGKKIFLLPAWPKDWDCEFKLHAPYQTIIAGKIVNGRVRNLEVTPAFRRNDVVILGDPAKAE